MSRLTRDGTTEPVSLDQILRHVRKQGIFICPVQLTTSRIANLTQLIHTLLYVMTIHTYHTYDELKAASVYQPLKDWRVRLCSRERESHVNENVCCLLL